MTDFPPWALNGLQYGLVIVVVWVLLRVIIDLRAALRSEQERNSILANEVISILRTLRESFSSSRSRSR